MYNKKVMKQKLFFILVIFFGLCTNKISAEVISDYNLNVRINQDYSTSLNLKVGLQNVSDTELISAYTLDLPFEVTNVNADLDGIPVSTLLDTNSTSSSLRVDFLTNVIKPQQKANLNLEIFTTNSIIQKYNIKEFSLPFPSSNYTYQQILVNIDYPNSFGSISYISEYKHTLNLLDDSFSRISLNQDSPLKVVWGNPSFALTINSNLENRKDSINHYLFGILPEYTTQIVDYFKTTQSDYGLVDSVNNTFAFLTIDKNSQKNIEFAANVQINSNANDNIYPSKYNWNLNLDSILGQKIYSQISQGADTLQKLKSLNEFLVKEYNITQENISVDSLSKVWDDTSKNLNSLQYCYLIVSTGEYMGLKGRVDYGYKFLNTTSGAYIPPTVWCVLEVNGKNILFDFSGQKNGNIDVTYSFADRVKAGTWHPSQSYNSMLGLLKNSAISALISDLSNSIHVSDGIGLEIDFPSNVYSGEFYSGLLNINNPTSKILKFNSIDVNLESQTNSIQVGDLMKAILPMQTNTIKIDYLRERDFILDLSRQVEISLDLSGTKLFNTVEIKFTPDFKLIGIFILILIVTISIFFYLIYKLVRTKV